MRCCYGKYVVCLLKRWHILSDGSFTFLSKLVLDVEILSFCVGFCVLGVLADRLVVKILC